MFKVSARICKWQHWQKWESYSPFTRVKGAISRGWEDKYCESCTEFLSTCSRERQETIRLGCWFAWSSIKKYTQFPRPWLNIKIWPYKQHTRFSAMAHTTFRNRFFTIACEYPIRGLFLRTQLLRRLWAAIWEMTLLPVEPILAPFKRDSMHLFTNKQSVALDTLMIFGTELILFVIQLLFTVSKWCTNGDLSAAESGTFKWWTWQNNAHMHMWTVLSCTSRAYLWSPAFCVKGIWSRSLQLLGILSTSIIMTTYEVSVSGIVPSSCFYIVWSASGLWVCYFSTYFRYLECNYWKNKDACFTEPKNSFCCTWTFKSLPVGKKYFLLWKSNQICILNSYFWSWIQWVTWQENHKLFRNLNRLHWIYMPTNFLFLLF